MVGCVSKHVLNSLPVVQEGALQLFLEDQLSGTEQLHPPVLHPRRLMFLMRKLFICALDSFSWALKINLPS